MNDGDDGASVNFERLLTFIKLDDDYVFMFTNLVLSYYR